MLLISDFDKNVVLAHRSVLHFRPLHLADDAIPDKSCDERRFHSAMVTTAWVNSVFLIIYFHHKSASNACNVTQPFGSVLLRKSVTSRANNVLIVRLDFTGQRLARMYRACR